MVGAFSRCRNVVKVTAPFVEEVEELGFLKASNLRHATFSPDVVFEGSAFFRCLSLEVLAISVGFELETGDTWVRTIQHSGVCGRGGMGRL